MTHQNHTKDDKMARKMLLQSFSPKLQTTVPMTVVRILVTLYDNVTFISVSGCKKLSLNFFSPHTYINVARPADHLIFLVADVSGSIYTILFRFFKDQNSIVLHQKRTPWLSWSLIWVHLLSRAILVSIWVCFVPKIEYLVKIENESTAYYSTSRYSSRILL